MRNIKLVIQYDGTNYSGWQIQPNRRTIQGSLEDALLKITKIQTRVIGAGRTDAKVHALAQVANFKTESAIPAEKFVSALNSVLPPDIRVIEASEEDENFHARFSARGKIYRYYVYSGKYLNVFWRNYVYYYPYPLDLDLMLEAAKFLEGTHDFRGLAAANSSTKNFIRTLKSVELKKEGEKLSLQFIGNGFLYNMVRITVGTLLEIGRKKIKPTVIKEIIETGNRSLAGPTVPAHGLFLVKVLYDDLL
ncbi:MAG TPA: tRNA pseudouridine(38-40) synthase TruA [Clostridia bacterium]|jgi:tRNA pseudouridine38-40 synthase|nr:tRNA pseudouridine(38-40) synthase TruA [Clostridia bacterium]